MATSEEKQELVDQLSGPRWYRISLHGYGGESAYLNLNHDQYEFWKTVVDEHGDSDLVEYMINAEDDLCDFANIAELPDKAEFLRNGDGDNDSWHDASRMFCHQYGVAYEHAVLVVEELESQSANNGPLNGSFTTVKTVVDGEELNSLLDSVMEEDDWKTELVEMDVAYGMDAQQEFVLQFYSSEKGTFFDGVFETVGDFDIRKLKVLTEEYPNGEDVVIAILYNGEEVENNGGDTVGKGFSAHLWKN